MLKIGDFSMLSKISINMLRHYNEIELLTPAHIDESTGYRYYHEEQLPTANRIQALKGMGMSLAMIKQIINQYDDTESLKKYLQIQLSHKNEDLAALKKQILLLNTAIKNLDEDTNFTKFSIEVKEIPKRTVISYRKKISAYNEEGILWLTMEQRTKHLKIQYSTPSYESAIFHNQTDTQSEIDVEIQKAVVEKFKDFDDIIFKEVPPIKVAAFTYKGEYTKLQNINEDIAKWVSDNQYEFDGEMFNIYHVSPKTEQHSENLLTEVCFPIKSK